MAQHSVGDVLPDGREIIAVDETLKRYGPDGQTVELVGVEYQFIQAGDDHVRRFQNWAPAPAAEG